MSAIISSIHYCPVKSVSFQNIEKCEIDKNKGMVNDRIFAFAKELNQEETKLFEKNPENRKGLWNKILTLKNSPVLNKYNFALSENNLILIKKNDEILSIDFNVISEREALSNKIAELEPSLKKPITLMKNLNFPFYDTSISKNVDFVNSVSLLNLNSIKDFEGKIGKKIQRSVFRGNICIEEIDAWREREWIGKTIKINDVKFKVKKNIPRCVAINLKPGTDDNTFSLLKELKKTYNHFEMGIYLTPINNGTIKKGNKLELIS